jgi:endonuclease III
MTFDMYVVVPDRSEDGLIVDTHIRRVCQRLGWASTNRTPEQTRLAIESWLPKGMWAETSLLLVGFGQQASCQILAFSSCPRGFVPVSAYPGAAGQVFTNS